MARRIVIWQALATVVVATVLLLWEISRGNWGDPGWGLDQTISALAAGVASVVPALWYAWRAEVERSPSRFLFQGIVKFALTILLVAAMIVLLEPEPAAFFGTLIVLQGMYVMGPLLEPEER